MKIDKQLQRKCLSTIKDIAVMDGYKKIQNTIYKIEDDYILFVDFLIVNSNYLNYRINIKKKSYFVLLSRHCLLEQDRLY